MSRTITVCQIGSCNLLNYESFTLGIPVGTNQAAYANVIGVDKYILAPTFFSLQDDYSNKFSIMNHNYFSSPESLASTCLEV